MQLLFLAQPRQVELQPREPLRHRGDLGVRPFDLLAEEGDLAGDLAEPLLPRLEAVHGGGEVVGQDLQLGADLAGARVRFLRRVDHGGPHQHALGRDERGAGVRPLLLGRLLHALRQVDVAKHGADDAASGRLGVHDGQELAFAAQPGRHRSSRRDREHGAVPAGGVRQRALAVVIDDGVRQRSQRGQQRPFQSGLDAHQVLQQAQGAALVALEEPRARRLLDVLAPRLQEVAPRLVAAADVVELLDLLRELAPLGLELRALLAHGRRLVVERLDLRLEPAALGLHLGDPVTHRRQLLRQTLALAFAGRHGPFQRRDLRPASGRVLADPAAGLLDRAAFLFGSAEGRLGLVQLALPQLEVGQHPHELALDALQLFVHGVDARRPRGLRRQLLAGRGARAVRPSGTPPGPSCARTASGAWPARRRPGRAMPPHGRPPPPAPPRRARPAARAPRCASPDPRPSRTCGDLSRGSARAAGRRRVSARARRPDR